MSQSPRVFSFLFLILGFLLPAFLNAREDRSLDFSVGQSVQSLVDQANRYYDEKSFALAGDLYQQLSQMDFSVEDQQRILFKLNDATWREAADPSRDDFREAQGKLEKLLVVLEEEAQRGRPPELWAEVQESLGDSWWLPEGSRDWGKAWSHYKEAFNYWAFSTDLNQARDAYLDLIRKITQVSPDVVASVFMRSNPLPQDVFDTLREGLRIVQKPNDKAYLNYLYAMALSAVNRPEDHVHIEQSFDEALNGSENADWYDDALFHYAVWSEVSGKLEYDDRGQFILSPNYKKAAQLYEELLAIYAHGESAYEERAKERVKDITDPSLAVLVDRTFRPKMDPSFIIEARNIERAKVALYPLSAESFFRNKDPEISLTQWIDTRGIPEDTQPVYTEEIDLDLNQSYQPISKIVKLSKKLDPGAYLVHLESEGQVQAESLLFITPAALVLKTSDDRVLAYCCDSQSGAPMPGAEIGIWVRSYQNGTWLLESYTGKANSDGLYDLKLPKSSSSREYFAIAQSSSSMAIAFSHAYAYEESSEDWRIYVYTDRAAYRQGDSVYWKAIARTRGRSGYDIPSGRSVRYVLINPKGDVLDRGKLLFNDFGSFSGEFKLREDTPLGEYRIRFKDLDQDVMLGETALFRLEDYQLPEYKISVEAVHGSGPSSSAFLIGDNVEVHLQADYYSGGGIADVDAVISVYQRPFFFFEGADSLSLNSFFLGDLGVKVEEHTLRTDGEGHGRFVFATSEYDQGDFEYIIEARLKNVGRQEVVDRKAIRVTQQPYSVQIIPEHSIYRPGEEVEVRLKVTDANGSPVSVEGRFGVTKEKWEETWTNAQGKEIGGPQLRSKLQDSTSFFSMFTKSLEDFWLQKEGYVSMPLSEEMLKSDENGQVSYRFKIPSEGYYRFYWISQEFGSLPVQAEANIWSTKRSSKDIGYHHGGLNLILDKKEYLPGERARVLVTTPIERRHVLLTVGSDELFEHALIYLDGTVKLFEFDVKNEYVPNVFIESLMVIDNQTFSKVREIEIPPEQNELQVSITPSEAVYSPRSEGVFELKTLDYNGNPVSAEVSLALVNSALFSLQGEQEDSPFNFFFGKKLPLDLKTASSFDWRPYQSVYARKQDVDQPAPIAKRASVLAISESMEPVHALDLESTYVEQMDALPVVFTDALIQVRSDFRDTLFWGPHILTDEKGLAEIRVSYPDSLTSWNATARAVAGDNQFGQAQVETQTRLPLIVRLHAPGFFTEGDQSILTGHFENRTADSLDIITRLNGKGISVYGQVDAQGQLMEMVPSRIRLNPETSESIKWLAEAKQSGVASLTLSGHESKFADAIEERVVINPHGLDQSLTNTITVFDESRSLSFNLSEEQSLPKLEVSLSPGIIPVLIGAVESILEKTPKNTEERLSQLLALYTLPELMDAEEKIRLELLKRLFPEIAELDLNSHYKEVLSARLEDIYTIQKRDGGWGWLPESRSDPFMSAYALWVLTTVQQGSVEVDSAVIRKAQTYIEEHLIDFEDSPSLQAWMLFAQVASQNHGRKVRPSKIQAKTFTNLWKNRDELTAFGKALIGLSAQYFDFQEEAKILTENLMNGLKYSGGGDFLKAHWPVAHVTYSREYSSAEASAWALIALLHFDSEHELLQPIVSWLLDARQGRGWFSNRESAWSVYALAQFIEGGSYANSEDYGWTLMLNDKRISDFDSGNSRSLPETLVLNFDEKDFLEGENVLELTSKGDTPLYLSIYLDYYNQQSPLPEMSSGVSVLRQYYHIKPVPTLLRGMVDHRELMDGGKAVQAGDLIEVALVVTCPQDQRYLILEDPKPAGCAPLQSYSGQYIRPRKLSRFASGLLSVDDTADLYSLSDRERYAGLFQEGYLENYEDHFEIYLPYLPEGTWEIRYTLRAETPGMYHALPAVARAAQVPRVRANSKESRIRIRG